MEKRSKRGSELSKDGKFRDSRASAFDRERISPNVDEVVKSRSPLAKDSRVDGRHEIGGGSGSLWEPRNMDDMTLMGRDDTSAIKKRLKRFVHERHSEGWMREMGRKDRKGDEEVEIDDLAKKVKKSVARYVPRRRFGK